MPFEKGKSGNPSGRPKQTEQERKFIELCRKYAPKAIKRLVELIDSENVSVAMRAAQIIAERAYGRPRQEIGMEVSQDESPRPPDIHITFIDNDGKPVTTSMDEYRKRTLAEKGQAALNA